MILIGIPTKEAKAEIEIHLITAETKIKSAAQYNLEAVQKLLFFLIINSFCSISSIKKKYLSHLYFLI